MPFGTGVTLLRSAPPIITDLRAWTSRPDSAQLKEERAGIEARLRSPSDSWRERLPGPKTSYRAAPALHAPADRSDRLTPLSSPLDDARSRGLAWMQRRVPVAVPVRHGGVEHLGVDDEFAAPVVLAW